MENWIDLLVEGPSPDDVPSVSKPLVDELFPHETEARKNMRHRSLQFWSHRVSLL